MGRSINKVILVGNVGRDPDIRTTTSGVKVAHFSLATNRRITVDESVEERTDWHRITLWNRLAQFAEDYITAGTRLYIEGRLEYDSYVRDGVTIPTAEVRVWDVVLLSPRSSTESQVEPEPVDEVAVTVDEAEAATQSQG